MNENTNNIPAHHIVNGLVGALLFAFFGMSSFALISVSLGFSTPSEIVISISRTIGFSIYSTSWLLSIIALPIGTLGFYLFWSLVRGENRTNIQTKTKE